MCVSTIDGYSGEVSDNVDVRDGVLASTLDVDRLSHVIADDILSGDRAYAERPIPRQSLVDIVAENLRSLLNSFGSADLDLGPARRAGQIKAEYGVELSGVLHAYRMAGLRLWSALEESSGLEDSGQSTLFPLGSELWTALDELSTAAAEAHREVAMARERWAEQSRFGAVVDLLSPMAAPERREAAARLLQVREGMRLFVLVMDEHSPEVEILGAREHWAEFNGARVCLLVQRESAEFLVSTDGARIGVSDEFRSLECAIEAERQARVALRCLGTAREGIGRYGQSLTDMLIVSQPREAEVLVRRTFTEVGALSGDSREILLDTFETWIKCGGSLSKAGELLHCHRNTVNYRLRRFETLTARSIGDPTDLTVLTLALRTIRLLGWPAKR
ncbi:helix-turn-helix domain-containing protein [Brevibacterium antiquum]